jgi:hypothetical protein
MTWYHAFLTYRDTDGAICQIIQYDIASVSTLHSELLEPLQAQRLLSLDGHMVSGLQAIQRLQIYQSVCSFAELQLPDGSSALDHAPETVRFLCERGIVKGVELYTPSMFLPLLQTVTASNRDCAGSESHTSGALTDLRNRGEGMYPTMWLYYVLCGYAALGNTVLTGLVRWVETGPNPTWLGALLRDDAPALAWPMLTSMLVGLGLLGTYYLVLLWRKSQWLLTFMNSCLLVVILTTNLVNLFTTSLEEPVPDGTLLIYVVPYLLLLAIVAAISFTFATLQLPDHRSDRDDHDPWSWHARVYYQNPVLVAITLVLLMTAVTAHLGLSSDYRLAYPLWFGYLSGGLVLWAVILRTQQRVYHQRTKSVVTKATKAIIPDLALPPLPPLDTLEADSLALPPLSSLDD